ncbi:terminase small subunit [Burkholderia multivorans]|uniref:terminase small subunit n=1 Tax=Burkholderia multivorans TaxID=87883 RepID=UPI002ED394D1|nr:terminase small subunit [Burkholderia multivorans]
MTLIKKELPDPENVQKGSFGPRATPIPDDAKLRITLEKDTETGETKRLTFQEETLCLEYIKDHNWFRACKRAGLKTSTDLRMQPHIRKRLEELHALKTQRHAIEAEAITEYLFNVVTADPNELAEVVTGACRYCYGYDISHLAKHGEYKYNHHYQFRNKEEQKRVKDANGGKYPHGNGGIGYSSERAPNPDCPMCDGRGETHYVVHDTNTFSNARYLIKGLKIGSNGQIEVQTLDKLKAAEMLLRTLGAFEADNKQKKDTNLIIEGGIDRELLKKLQSTSLDDLEAELQAQLRDEHEVGDD